MRSILKKTYKKLIQTFFKCLYGRIKISEDQNLISKIKIKDKLFESKKYFIYLIKYLYNTSPFQKKII